MFDDALPALATNVGLSLSQLQFILAFFASFPLSAGLHYVPTSTLRNLYSFAAGVALLYYVFGWSMVYIFPPCIVTYLAMLMAPRRAFVIAWATAMPYLIFWHEVGASGTAWREGKLDFTGALMVVTLKLISCAGNLSDGFQDSKNLRPFQTAHLITAPPRPLEYAGFLMAVGNLLAGPHMHIKTYLEFVNSKGDWAADSARRMPNPLGYGVMGLLLALFCMLVHLALTHLGFGVSAFTDDWFFNLPFLGRMGMLWLCGFTARWKYYFVWSLAHSALIVSGYSFQGFDEKSGKPKWDRGRNQDILGLEFCKSGAEIPLNWNIQTGMWLRHYCYDRLTPIGKKPGFWPLLITQLASGVWHGLFPGYIMFFSGVALLIFSSRIIYSYQKHLTGAPRIVATAMHGLFTSVCLNFLASAFQLLTWEESIAVWNSVYQLPLVLMLLVCALGPLLRRSSGARQREGKKTSTADIRVHAE
mmetsp:Transcript_35075/g.99455  ORF Transcript_35075/g.99455 Transcript_35075/m.99455 type:complete len:473 (-) Transcript_35075:198-1616(-)